MYNPAPVYTTPEGVPLYRVRVSGDFYLSLEDLLAYGTPAAPSLDLSHEEPSPEGLQPLEKWILDPDAVFFLRSKCDRSQLETLQNNGLLW